MNALANCKAALEGLLAGKENQQLFELQTLVHNTQLHLSKHQVSRVDKKEASPRVEKNQPSPKVDNDLPMVDRISHKDRNLHRAIRNAAQQRAKCQRPSLQHLTFPINLPNKPPVHSTRSKVKAIAAPIQRSTQRLHQPTRASHGKTKVANAVFSSPSSKRKFMQVYKRFKQEVEQAMAAGVMDKETGKILQYRQLLHHPKFKKDLTKSSSANEFGRLAKGVGGHIKNPAETI
jgi:hypothetical protein